MSAYGFLAFQGATLPIEKKSVIIGRAPSCHLVFSHPSISKEHAKIEFKDDGYATIKDLGSMNGTFVNKKCLTRDEEYILKPNDLITFAKALDPNIYTFVINNVFQSPAKEIVTVSNPQNLDKPVKLVDTASIKTNQVQIQSPPHKNLETFNPKTSSTSPIRSSIKKDTIGGALTASVASEDIARYEKEFYRSQFADSQAGSQNELMYLFQRVRECEDIISQKDLDIDACQKEIHYLLDEAEKLNVKLKAVEVYASDLQRKNDELLKELAEKNQKVIDYQTNDWAKISQEQAIEIKHLRQIFTMKESEIFSLKEQIEGLLKPYAETNANIPYIQHVMEQQSKELTITRKRLEEYEARESECKRKWSELIKTHVNMEEEITGLKFQLKREMESYQQLYSSNNEKIAALYQKIGELVNESKASQERQAADILVREMRELREENARIAQDNEQLHFEIQGFINEVKRLTNELEECNKYFKATDSVLADSKIPDYGKMKSRIEELEDTIIELQKNGGVNKAIELTELVANLERQLAHESKNLDELRSKLLNYNPQISRDANQQNLIEHLSQTLEEKDARINYLQNEFDSLKNKERYYEGEVHRLRESLAETSLQLEEYKLKQSKLEGILSTKYTGTEGNVGVGQRPSTSDGFYANRQKFH